jgi:hypothetical protein
MYLLEQPLFLINLSLISQESRKERSRLFLKEKNDNKMNFKFVDGLKMGI